MKKALLDKEQDPFNRAPLKYTDLVEMPELKAKIEAWKALKSEAKGKKAPEIDLEDYVEIPEKYQCSIYMGVSLVN